MPVWNVWAPYRGGWRPHHLPLGTSIPFASWPSRTDLETPCRLSASQPRRCPIMALTFCLKLFVTRAPALLPNQSAPAIRRPSRRVYDPPPPPPPPHPLESEKHCQRPQRRWPGWGGGGGFFFFFVVFFFFFFFFFYFFFFTPPTPPHQPHTPPTTHNNNH